MRNRSFFPSRPFPRAKNRAKTVIFGAGISIALKSQAFMEISPYQAAPAICASNCWQEVIPANLAAIEIPDFKKQELP